MSNNNKKPTKTELKAQNEKKASATLKQLINKVKQKKANEEDDEVLYFENENDEVENETITKTVEQTVPQIATQSVSQTAPQITVPSNKEIDQPNDNQLWLSELQDLKQKYEELLQKEKLKEVRKKEKEKEKLEKEEFFKALKEDYIQRSNKKINLSSLINSKKTDIFSAVKF